MKKGLWLILLIVVIGGGAWLVQQRSVGHSEARKIKIAQFGDFFLYAPLYVAIDAGFFAQQGIEVSLVSTGGDEKTWAAVVSGDASFGVADPTFVAIAAQRGQPGKVVASIVNGVPFWGVTFRTDIGPMSDTHALAGLTVATFPSPSTAFALQTKMYRDAGLEPRIRQGAFGALLPMLRAKEADIALELEPNVSQAVEQGAHVVYSMKNLYGDFAITGLTTSDRTVSTNPQLVQDVVCSLQLALDFLRARPDSSLAILTKRFPEISPQVAKNALERVLSERIIPENVTVGGDAWDRAIALRTSIGDLAKPLPITAYVNNSFAQKATQRCRMK